MADPKSMLVNFELSEDQFPHAWFFNRFRIDRLGQSLLITLALATEAGGPLAVNAIVVSDNDVKNGKERSLEFLQKTDSLAKSAGSYDLSFSAPPTRVYPINMINLSRVDQLGEFGFYRYSVAGLAKELTEEKQSKGSKVATVKCYPVVMFRCDLAAQVALIKEIYSH